MIQNNHHFVEPFFGSIFLSHSGIIFCSAIWVFFFFAKQYSPRALLKVYSFLFRKFFPVRGHCCLRKVYASHKVPNIHFAQTKVTPSKKGYTNRTTMGFSCLCLTLNLYPNPQPLTFPLTLSILLNLTRETMFSFGLPALFLYYVSHAA